MLGLIISTKRELEFLTQTIKDKEKQIDWLKLQLAGEKARANAAVNMVLAKQAGVMLNPQTDADLEGMFKKAEESMDLFSEADNEAKAKAEFIEKLQS